LKNPITKKGWWSGSRCRLMSSNSSTTKKVTKLNKNSLCLSTKKGEEDMHENSEEEK
jgi:hypothetical protein